MNKPLTTDAQGEVRELDGTDFAKFRPASEVMGDDFMAMVRTRGKQKSPVKEAISIRFDADIVDYFKSQGKGWQTAMNNALREYIATH